MPHLRKAPNDTRKMKNTLYPIFRLLISLVLFAKILNWILHFNDETNRILNMIMLIIIGIAYLVIGYMWDSKLTKIIITTCGLFLITMNFLGNNILLDILTIICILTPMLIVRYSTKSKEEKEVQQI